ncbi:hypothetical protein L4C54_22220 [Vibrio lamellibrachiae]|uniref:hypothetical protein n=1 Tax=Vibrio lamellibrachiae TaxID=2910253 RepID=UPI003D107B69
MKCYLLAILLTSSLVGCADHVIEATGTSVEMAPITYHLKIASDDLEQATQKFDEFIVQYQLQGSTADWTLAVKDNKGEKLLSALQERLTQHRISSEQITQQVLAPSSRYMLEVNATRVQVRLAVCQQDKVGYYGYGHMGCYTDGSRWQSMVNPEKSL